jgi:uncharacterized membrane protein YccC
MNLGRLFPVGVLMLSGGLLLHNFLHARSIEFAAGFLIGMSIVFLIAKSVKRFNRPRLH